MSVCVRLICNAWERRQREEEREEERMKMKIGYSWEGRKKHKVCVRACVWWERTRRRVERERGVWRREEEHCSERANVAVWQYAICACCLECSGCVCGLCKRVYGVWECVCVCERADEAEVFVSEWCGVFVIEWVWSRFLGQPDIFTVAVAPAGCCCLCAYRERERERESCRGSVTAKEVGGWRRKGKEGSAPSKRERPEWKWLLLLLLLCWCKLLSEYGGNKVNESEGKREYVCMWVWVWKWVWIRMGEYASESEGECWWEWVKVWVDDRRKRRGKEY